MSNYDKEKLKTIDIQTFKSDNDIAVDFYLTEYKSLRDEISLYHQQQKQLMYFALLLIASFLGFISTKIQWIENNDLILLAMPSFFIILGMMFADRTVRIIRIAHYLDTDLKNRVNNLIGRDVLNWENYKRNTTIVNKKIAKILDQVRWFIFLFPSLLILTIYLQLHGIYRWNLDNIILFMINILFIMGLIIIIFLFEETSGVNRTK
ncbi:MAG: hypothetical protein ACYDDB_02940 [bacterium]